MGKMKERSMQSEDENLNEAHQKIGEAAELLGWELIIPNGDEDSEVEYLILVKPGKADEILEKLEDEWPTA